MIDIAKEIIRQIKTELLPNEDRWGTLTEDQYTQLYISRNKILSLETIIEGLQNELNACKNLIELMGGV